MDPFLLEKEYEKQFLMLRICVLGTIGSVLSSLALMFWIYFMYLWRTWDSGKSRSGDSSGGGGLGHGGSQAVLLCEDGTTLSKRKSLGSMASDGTGKKHAFKKYDKFTLNSTILAAFREVSGRQFHLL